jgi:hypothetical protein
MDAEETLDAMFASTIVDQALAAIDMTSMPLPEGVKPSHKSAAKKALLDHIKKELLASGAAKRMRAMLRHHIEERVLQWQQELDAELRKAKAAKDEAEQAREQFLESDPTAKRLMFAEESIDRMIPLTTSHSSYEYQQALRSRALVLAAACGLTHYAYPSPHGTKYGTDR